MTAATTILHDAEATAAAEVLATAETIFGHEASGIRESVRIAAERIGAERGLSPALLAEGAMELARRKETP